MKNKKIYEKMSNRFSLFLFKSVICLAVFIVSFRLFFRQIINPELFVSDTSVHLKYALEGKGYSYLMPVLGVIFRLFGSYGNAAIAATEAFALVFTILIVNGVTRQLDTLTEKQSFLISVACIFLSSMYIPILQPMFYKSGIVTQPWHNMTYIFMRLFAAMTFVSFVKGIEYYQTHISLTNWIAISVPLMLATAVKPSFLIGFSWTLLAFLIEDVIRNKLTGKSIIQCIKMGTTVFPALFILFLQSKILYRPDGGSGIEIALLDSRFFLLGISGTILKLVRGLLLASIVIIYNRNRVSRCGSFIIVQYVISLMVAIIFRETGQRTTSGNFYWGLYCAGFFLMLYVWVLFMTNWNEIKERDAKKNRTYFITCSILSFLHIVSGFIYFAIISMGGDYGF